MIVLRSSRITSYDLTEEEGSGENPFAVVRPDARAFPAVESRGLWRLELLVDGGSDCAELSRGFQLTLYGTEGRKFRTAGQTFRAEGVTCSQPTNHERVTCEVTIEEGIGRQRRLRLRFPFARFNLYQLKLKHAKTGLEFLVNLSTSHHDVTHHDDVTVYQLALHFPDHFGRFAHSCEVHIRTGSHPCADDHRHFRTDARHRVQLLYDDGTASEFFTLDERNSIDNRTAEQLFARASVDRFLLTSDRDFEPEISGVVVSLDGIDGSGWQLSNVAIRTENRKSICEHFFCCNDSWFGNGLDEKVLRRKFLLDGKKETRKVKKDAKEIPEESYKCRVSYLDGAKGNFSYRLTLFAGSHLLGKVFHVDRKFQDGGDDVINVTCSRDWFKARIELADGSCDAGSWPFRQISLEDPDCGERIFIPCRKPPGDAGQVLEVPILWGRDDDSQLQVVHYKLEFESGTDEPQGFEASYLAVELITSDRTSSGRRTLVDKNTKPKDENERHRIGMVMRSGHVIDQVLVTHERAHSFGSLKLFTSPHSYQLYSASGGENSGGGSGSEAPAPQKSRGRTTTRLSLRAHVTPSRSDVTPSSSSEHHVIVAWTTSTPAAGHVMGAVLTGDDDGEGEADLGSFVPVDDVGCDDDDSSDVIGNRFRSTAQVTIKSSRIRKVRVGFEPAPATLQRLRESIGTEGWWKVTGVKIEDRTRNVNYFVRCNEELRFGTERTDGNEFGGRNFVEMAALLPGDHLETIPKEQVLEVVVEPCGAKEDDEAKEDVYLNVIGEKGNDTGRRLLTSRFDSRVIGCKIKTIGCWQPKKVLLGFNAKDKKSKWFVDRVSVIQASCDDDKIKTKFVFACKKAITKGKNGLAEAVLELTSSEKVSC